MLNLLRFWIFLIFAMLCQQTLAQHGDFNGSWIALLCPPGAAGQLERCSSFVITLFQKQDKLCGSHLFATAGAEQMDEGGLPSIVGRISSGNATVTVESIRASPPVRLKADLKLDHGLLRWQLMANGEGNYLLPLSAQLSKAKRGTLFHPLFEQRLNAACSQVLNAVEDEASPAPPP
jgi:hypothetical protein